MTSWQPQDRLFSEYADMQAISLIDKDGVRDLHPADEGRRALAHAVADVSEEQLLAYYQDMVVARRIDAEATALQRQGQLGLWTPLRGQEAAQIGSAHALERKDFVFTSFRDHGVAYCRGIKPVEMLPFWRGSTKGGWDPFEHNTSTPAIIVGAQGLHAVGYAMGIKFDGSDAVSIAYFGDGATSEGDISEAFAFASSFAVPVVFFCQNNQWAISEPVRVQSGLPLAARGFGYGIPGIRVDGNDVLAVLAATRIALQRAREGLGPMLIEAFTYRMGPHTTADDPTRYRASAEVDYWADRDPIARLEAYLDRRGVLTDDARATVSQVADQAAADARRGAMTAAEPSPLELFDHVYAQPTTHLLEQRAELASYLSDDMQELPS